jgi:uncharacterized protein YcfJ
MIKKTLMAVMAVGLLAAAVPEPVQAQSLQDRCEDYAARVAWRRGNRNAVGEGAVGGAIVGGALGAILGKGRGKNIVGGAIAGTAAGALIGSANGRGGYLDRRAYRRAYNTCINENTRVRYRGEDDDVAYCASRYRSYNPRTGLYRTYSGAYKSCP